MNLYTVRKCHVWSIARNDIFSDTERDDKKAIEDTEVEIVEYPHAHGHLALEEKWIQETINLERQYDIEDVEAAFYLRNTINPQTGKLMTKEEVDEIIRQRKKNRELALKHARSKRLRINVGKAVASGTLKELSNDKEYRDLYSDSPLNSECRIVELKNGEKHVLRVLYDKVPVEPPEFKHISNELVVCVECNTQVGNTVADQSNHLKKFHRQQFAFKCKLCSKPGYKVNSDFECQAIHQHIRKHHLKDDQYFQCKKCKAVFWIKSKYEKHVEKCAGRKPKGGICNQCGEHARILSNHMMIHKPRSFHCLKCPLVFKSQQALSGHKNNVHSDDPQKQAICGDCGKICKNALNLNAHMSKVHPKVLHKCTYQGCNKEFKTKDALKNHAFIHLDKKPMRCDYCEFSCRQRNSMDVHMRVHHKDKSYDRAKSKRYGTKVKGRHIHFQD